MYKSVEQVHQKLQHQLSFIYDGIETTKTLSHVADELIAIMRIDQEFKMPEPFQNNWTEQDVWDYIAIENIPVVPLYFAAPRPIVKRDGALIMRDDDRMKLQPGESVETMMVRFRTLGCYPLTGAVESSAATLPEIIQEMLLTRTSERQGRVIDHDSAGSMEEKKRQGYF
mgnify:CR=1 FL=1